MDGLKGGWGAHNRRDNKSELLEMSDDMPASYRIQAKSCQFCLKAKSIKINYKMVRDKFYCSH